MKLFLKYSVEGSLTWKSGVFIDLCNALVCMEQVIAGVIQAHFVEIGVEIAVKCAGKHAGQYIRTVSKISCHLLQGEILCEICGDITDRLINNVACLHERFVCQFEERQRPGKQDLGIRLPESRGMFSGSRISKKTFQGVFYIRMDEI